MDISSFAIWKFRHIEGLLENMHASDLTVTKYIRPIDNEVVWIRYDYVNETAAIQSGPGTLKCKLSDLIQTLKDIGMYVELPEDRRHHLAGPQKEE